ncbi:protein tyrosine phosphatase, partial [Klebsiella pneumoniae]
PTKKIDSAGTGALVDRSADPSAEKISLQNDLSLAGHKARQFTSELARKYELILVMDKTHIEEIGKLAPEARGKTMLFGHWMNHREIPDPYRKSDEAFASVYQLIKLAGDSWIEKLSS